MEIALGFGPERDVGVQFALARDLVLDVYQLVMRGGQIRFPFQATQPHRARRALLLQKDSESGDIVAGRLGRTGDAKAALRLEGDKPHAGQPQKHFANRVRRTSVLALQLGRLELLARAKRGIHKLLLQIRINIRRLDPHFPSLEWRDASTEFR